VTDTVRSVLFSTRRLEGDAAPTPVGEVDAAVTVSEIDVDPVRDCPSVMVTGKLFPPGLVPAVTVAVNVNTLPEPLNTCADEPPIELRLAVTPNPVLVGFAPGVTVTVSVVVPPACTDAGAAAPLPVGFVGVGGAEFVGVNAMPRNAVFVGADANDVTAPAIAALYPLVSVSRNRPDDEVRYNVTPELSTVPVTLRTPNVAPTLLLATHVPPTSEYFSTPPVEPSSTR
jgi:hypothetical protein